MAGKGKIKIVNRKTQEVKWVDSNRLRRFVNEWDIYAFGSTPASIEYLKKHGLIK